MQIITVNPGDTVYSIARTYNLSPEAILVNNGINADGLLVSGQSLVLVFPEEVRINAAFSSVQSVSAQSGVPTRTIFRNNYFLQGANTIPPDRQIVLQVQDPPQRTKILGGYAYDFIPDSLLRSVISYMTYVMPFTYGFSADGTLVEPDDKRLVRVAQEYGAMPLMHLSTLTPDGFFSNETPHELFGNSAALERLYQNILNTVRQKNYAGVDVDFEYLFAEDRQAYVEFIGGLAERLNAEGYILVVALPPKTSDDQTGLLYEGIDYAGLGEAANYAFLMTYEWGYRFGPPLAVAPINAVRRVVDYALTRIPKEKLLLGIPNYGYDWTLPYERGVSEAPSLSTIRALDIALQYGAEILYDTDAQSPYFYYTDDQGKEHVVWFEDARSYAAKVALFMEYDLAGAFIWDLMRENPAGFVTLNGLIDIR